MGKRVVMDVVRVVRERQEGAAGRVREGRHGRRRSAYAIGLLISPHMSCNKGMRISTRPPSVPPTKKSDDDKPKRIDARTREHRKQALRPFVIANRAHALDDVRMQTSRDVQRRLKKALRAHITMTAYVRPSFSSFFSPAPHSHTMPSFVADNI